MNDANELVLEIIEGAGLGQRTPVGAGIEIGRDPRADLPLLDPLVSHRHLRVSAHGAGALAQDLESTNGTYVNDQPVHVPRQLSPGDRIRLGATVIALRTVEQLATTQVAVPVPPIADASEVMAPVPEHAYSQIEALLDSRVKRQTSVVAFALLAVAALATVIYFGAS